VECSLRFTSHRLLDGGFHVGGAHHHVAGSIQDDTLPRPLVQEQHLAFTCHHILASQGSNQSVATETSISHLTSLQPVIGCKQPDSRPAKSPSLYAHTNIEVKKPTKEGSGTDWAAQCSAEFACRAAVMQTWHTPWLYSLDLLSRARY